MRTLQYAVAIMTIFSLGLDLWQALRYNLAYGISDFMLFCFSGAVFSPLFFAMTQLPTLVLFQKMTPMNVEATMMAFSASVVNMSNGLMGSLTGYILNKYFFQVTKENLHERYYIIPIIQIFCCFYELVIIRLIPTNEEIKDEIEKRQSMVEMTTKLI